MAKEYLVQPQMYGDRKADYETMESINKKWKPITSKEAFEKFPKGFSGNIGMHVATDKKTLKVKIDEEYAYNSKTHVSLSNVISSALALYRIICMIKTPIVETEGADGYKVPWSVHLIHVETGEILGVSEWKGAFGIWTRFYKIDELPESYKNDVIELLDLMFSDKSPHPYDNCTAGIVA